MARTGVTPSASTGHRRWWVLALIPAAFGLSLLPSGSSSASSPGVYTWGWNANGELGDNTNTGPQTCSGQGCSTTPVVVDGVGGVGTLRGATAIAAGYAHSLARTHSGEVYAWGLNMNGQLGDGTNTDSATPVQVQLPGAVDATAVAAGNYHSLVLTDTGAVYAWGLNGNGQLGDGTNTDRNTPVQVQLPAGVTAIAVAGGAMHSLALASTGTVYAWGYNQWGQLGDGTNTDRNTPVQVQLPLPPGVTVTAVAAGTFHSLALTSSGTVYAWGGLNGNGTLGNGTTSNSLLPVQVSLPPGVTPIAIAAGEEHSFALTSTGAVYAWGVNGSGQLGIGLYTNNSDTPVSVSLPSTVTATAVAAGFGDGLALTSTGAVYDWGANGYGQLGNGTTTQSDTPVSVSLPSAFTPTVIAAGGFHSLALREAPVTLFVATAVNGGSDTGNNCTLAAAPCATITHAVTQQASLGCGPARINVARGTYTETGLTLMGPCNDHLAIVGSGSNTIIKPLSLTSENAGLEIFATAGDTIKKISVDATSGGTGSTCSPTDFGILAIDDTNLTIRSSLVGGSNCGLQSSGVELQDVSNSIVSNNLIGVFPGNTSGNQNGLVLTSDSTGSSSNDVFGNTFTAAAVGDNIGIVCVGPVVAAWSSFLPVTPGCTNNVIGTSAGPNKARGPWTVTAGDLSVAPPGVPTNVWTSPCVLGTSLHPGSWSC